MLVFLITFHLHFSGAIFQTAYTSSIAGTSAAARASTGPSSSATASATASGPRISSTSDLFAPELYISEDFEDPTGQLFADDSDQDDEMDQGKDN